MPLAPGARLGPYEILAAIGAGGMGEVYRAKDPRLGREVAIKVVSASFSVDADRLRRFEQEAKAAGVLNHPNVTAVYDIGTHEGAPYVVQELLEGETLRSVLSGGKLSTRKAIDYSLQIVHGLAAAHEKGIVHRDLKPENLFVTNDGRVKILDFGLAKLTHTEERGVATNLPTATAGTEPGVVMGTLGYMSPEQVRGKPADARSDIFSFGAILYEMLSGRRAFHGDSPADTMSAILKEDPPDLSLTNQSVPPGLERVVRHCLEKNPEQRFHSAHDVAFNLEALSGASAVTAAFPARRSSRRPWLAAAGLAFLALYSAGVYFAGRGSRPAAAPTFQQLTFRRGIVGQARFAPDGQTVIYAAAWDGKPSAVFATRPGSPESSPLALPNGAILGINPSGQLALLIGIRAAEPYVASGTLAEAPLAGGEAPRERLHGVQWADWSPDGKRLAIVRDEGGRNRLESPVGTVLYESSGWIGHPRFSPSGDGIAFLDHWARNGDLGSVVVVSLSGKAQKLSGGWVSLQGLAWWPDGKEIWFTGTKFGGNRSLWAVDRSGRLRLVFRQTGALRLEDISPSKNVLLIEGKVRVGVISRAPGQNQESDLSWLDFSALRDISRDGKKILFDESSEGGGEEGTMFLRDTDGSPPVRLGPGFGMGLSPDEHFVVSSTPKKPQTVRLVPAGAGEPRVIAEEPFPVTWAAWMPDGKGILLSGGEAGHGVRLYLQNAEGGPARAVSPEGVHLIPYSNLISPDGKFVPAMGPDRTVLLYPLDGSAPRRIPGLEADEVPCGWDAAGRVLYVYRPGELPARISRLDVETGMRQPWTELMPGDPTGITFIRAPHFARDGASYAYSYSRLLSELYLVKGLQ
jgi:eukaryotic-like serine/threonine-protein kinase